VTLKNLVTFVAPIVATVTGALSPWVGPFFEFKVISDYFQPQLNALATLLVVMAFMFTYVMWRKAAQRFKKQIMIWSLAGAFVLYFVCLILKSTVGVTWAPGIITTIVIRTVWIVIYLLTFVLLAVGLCSMVMLVPSNETNT
jgi:hypothetical protein